MFACIGTPDQGVAVKTADPDFAGILIEAGDAQRAPCFHRSWVLIPRGPEEGFTRDRIGISCDLVRSGLTKKLQATLRGRG